MDTSGWRRGLPNTLTTSSPLRRRLIREDLVVSNSAGTVYTLPGWWLPLLEGVHLSRFGVMRVIGVAGLPLAPALERGLCHLYGVPARVAQQTFHQPTNQPTMWYGVSNKFLSVSVSVSDRQTDRQKFFFSFNVGSRYGPTAYSTLPPSLPWFGLRHIWVQSVTVETVCVTEHHGWGRIQDVRFPERVGTRDCRPWRWCGSC